MGCDVHGEMVVSRKNNELGADKTKKKEERNETKVALMRVWLFAYETVHNVNIPCICF